MVELELGEGVGLGVREEVNGNFFFCCVDYRVVWIFYIENVFVYYLGS